MAIYHLNAKTIGRSQGRSSTAAAAYRAGIRIEDKRTGLVFDFTRKSGVDGSEILAPDGSSPDRGELWNAVEKSEKRRDAQVAREVVIALPVELKPDEMRAAVRAFVQEQFVSLGMFADIAFHQLTGTNPHAHILLTLREWGEQGFGLKRRDWNDQALCVTWRERWTHHANEALAVAGHDARIDHRTLTEQAIEAFDDGRHCDAEALDRIPTIHEKNNSSAREHNVAVRGANAHREGQRSIIEPTRPQPIALPVREATARLPRRARLQVADAAFMATMEERQDLDAAEWRHVNRRVNRLADWLRTNEGEMMRRKAASSAAAHALHEARYARGKWQEENPRPLWPWRWAAWRKHLSNHQNAVSTAKREARLASTRCGVEAAIVFQREYEAKQSEHDAAIISRRALKQMPGEQASARRKLQREKAETKRREENEVATMLEGKAVATRPRIRPR